MSINFRIEQSQLHLLQVLGPLLAQSDKAYLVGGLVRDTLLGRIPKDLDIAVSGDAAAVARNITKVLDGNFVVMDGARNYFRVVLREENRQATIRTIDVSAFCGDIFEDLARRDFTIDAMAIPIHNYLSGNWRENIIDPCNGLRDLELGLIRATGTEVFLEDSIRALRAVRLVAQLGFTIEVDTRDSIQRHAGAIRDISGERVRDELLAILAAPRASSSLYLMDELGLLSMIIPELDQGRGVTQPKEHYWDVFRHNVETVAAIEGVLDRDLTPSWIIDEVPWDDYLQKHFQEISSDGHSRATLCKLAGLLHDIAKPATKTVEPSGKIRFLGHNRVGADMACAILQRLRLSGKGVEMVQLMVDLHMRPGQMSQGVEIPTPRAIYRYFCRAENVAIDTIFLNLADYIAARGTYLQHAEWVAYSGMVRHILEAGLFQDEAVARPRILDGHTLIKHLSLSPGPLVGRLLNIVKEAHAAGEIGTTGEALTLARKQMKAFQREGVHA